MLCRITDEDVKDAWEVDREELPKTIDEYTLGELMGQEHDMYLSKNKAFGYKLDIENEDGELITESQLTEACIESMASFCRKFLHDYDAIQG